MLKKKILALLSVLLIAAIAVGQSQGTIPYGVTTFEYKGGNAEVILKNATRNVKGFIYNKGNGVTEFRRGLIQIGPNQYLIGNDTLNLNGYDTTSLSNRINFLSNSKLNKADTLNRWQPKGNYLTTELDPSVPLYVKNITYAQKIAWDSAYNKASFDTTTRNLTLQSSNGNIIELNIPTSPSSVTSVFGRAGAIVALLSDYSAYYPSLSGSYSNPTWINSLAWSKITGAPAFITTETDPTVASYIKSITSTNITNWNSAFGWGNHATAGYFSNFLITSPTSGQVLKYDGTKWINDGAGSGISALTGDVTGSGSGTVSTTIANSAVTDAKLRNSAGVSVIGRSANTTGAVADITAVSDNTILRRASGVLGFGTIGNNFISDLAYSKLTGVPGPINLATSNLTQTASSTRTYTMDSVSSLNFNIADPANQRIFAYDASGFFVGTHDYGEFTRTQLAVNAYGQIDLYSTSDNLAHTAEIQVYTDGGVGRIKLDASDFVQTQSPFISFTASSNINNASLLIDSSGTFDVSTTSGIDGLGAQFSVGGTGLYPDNKPGILLNAEHLAISGNLDYLKYTAPTTNFTYSNYGPILELPTISANRTVTILDNPSSSTFRRYIIVNNKNTSATFSWLISGNVKNPDGTTFASFPKQSITQLIWDGINWIAFDKGGGTSYTNADARLAISLTTTGSGAATYNNSTGVLNIPNYSTLGTTWNGIFGGTATSSTTLTLTAPLFVQYVFNGSSPTTWTVPTLSGNGNTSIFIKNAGTATLTLARQSTDQFFDGSASTTATIPAGGGVMISSSGSGSYWYVYGNGAGNSVTSFNGRTGAVVPATNDYTFAQIGTKPTTLSGYGITDAQALSAQLTNLASLATNGVVARTASNTFAARTISGTAGRVVFTNGDGVSGNPTADLASGIATPGTYGSVTVDTYGRVTAGTNPTDANNFTTGQTFNPTTEVLSTQRTGLSDVTVSLAGFYPKVARFLDSLSAIRSSLNDFTISNGDATGGREELVTAISATEAQVKTLGLNFSGGITGGFTANTNSLDINIDGSGLAQFLSGAYTSRPVSALLGQIYYQTDLLEGQYIWDGAAWQLTPDDNTLVWSKMLGNVYPMNGNSVGTGAGNFQSDVQASSWRMDTGTDAAGLSQIRTSQNFSSTLQTTGKLIWSYKNVRVSALSDGTNTFTVRVGRSAVADGLGAFFKYTHSNSSGQWECITHNGTTATTTASGVTMAANTDYNFLIVYDFTGTDNVKFYINNTLVATHTTNLPTNFTGAYQGSISILKSVGTTNRNLIVDDIIIKQIL